MFNRSMLYDLIYALAAREGREATLFGTCAPLAREAFARSLAAESFPELWFEIPLAGEPWFDLHALTDRSDLRSDMTFVPETCGNTPEAFSWFASQGAIVRQLALSWDVSSGDVEHPAVQLLLWKNDPETTCGFLAAVGRADATPAYRSFWSSIPKGWFACYTGVFPGRAGHNLRVECIPSEALQQAYAQDAFLLEAHLRQAGLTELGDTLIPRCQALARTPFRLEFQFDVNPRGRADTTFGASVRFAPPSETSALPHFDPNGSAGEIMRQVVAWDLADERWRQLSGTIVTKRATLGSETTLLYCYPAFLKLRWRNGMPLDAKAYLIAGIQ